MAEVRRSSRLANKTPIEYKEEPVVEPRRTRSSVRGIQTNAPIRATPKESLPARGTTSPPKLESPEAIPIKKTCDELRTLIPLKRTSPSQEKPVAIFLTGPAGAGKSTLLNQFLPKKLQYDYYNVDDYQEKLLEINGLIAKQNHHYVNATPDKIYKLIGDTKDPEKQKQALSAIQSIVGTMMGISKKCTEEDFLTMIQSKKNIIVDRPGDKPNMILKQKKQLEDNGYETYMVMIYASPLTILYRNAKRHRSLLNSVVLRIWDNLMESIPIYQKEFQTFMIVQNDMPPMPYSTLKEHVSISEEHYQELSLKKPPSTIISRRKANKVLYKRLFSPNK